MTYSYCLALTSAAACTWRALFTWRGHVWVEVAATQECTGTGVAGCRRRKGRLREHILLNVRGLMCRQHVGKVLMVMTFTCRCCMLCRQQAATAVTRASLAWLITQKKRTGFLLICDC
jgi:hypothetical protein